MSTKLEPVYLDLMKTSVIRPLSLDDEEQSMFVDFELAALAEHRLGDRTDPRTLDTVRRADWFARAIHEDSAFTLPKHQYYQTCFWLLDEEGKRCGTIAFSDPMSMSMARCYSYYLLPEARGRGLGSRIMTQVLRTLDNHGFALRLNTDWTWQRTVRFYRTLGFWVYHWKRDLDLIWVAQWPTPRIDVGETEASISVPYKGSDVTLARAHRNGDKLEIEHAPHHLGRNDEIGEPYYAAAPTLMLELAMHGWPLVRSAELWKKNYFADAGPPEALAYKITIWEAYARSRQWIVETPRVAGLAYPTWEEFEARWAKENEEFEAKMKNADQAEETNPEDEDDHDDE